MSLPSMSGLEVTGIVLSSIPLLIIALEKYTEGLFTLHRWRKYKRELQSLIRNLETERIKLQNFCEKLPLDLVPHYNIEALIDNPMGDLWREEETLKKVQFRLGKGFKVFQDTANDLRATLCDIGRLIDSQGEGMFPGLKRAVFTLSRSQYAGILTEIRDSVSNLENLTNGNMELEPARIVRSKQKHGDHGSFRSSFTASHCHSGVRRHLNHWCLAAPWAVDFSRARDRRHRPESSLLYCCDVVCPCCDITALGHAYRLWCLRHLGSSIYRQLCYQGCLLSDIIDT
ncbi:hypothetical protein HZ326_16457 [Fusarium oxysporum f. sp. albedinis]|nr:hypothetical protein HZ326_16457 [Fusarium oxysporum f. sp. albedinis]